MGIDRCLIMEPFSTAVAVRNDGGGETPGSQGAETGYSSVGELQRESFASQGLIDLALDVRGGRWLSAVDAVVDRQPDEHKAIADAIERSPTETTRRFKHWVRDFADDLRWL